MSACCPSIQPPSVMDAQPTMTGESRLENSADPRINTLESISQKISARLGDRLLARGVITKDQLSQALDTQRRHPGFLGQVLINQGFTDSNAVGRVLAEDFGLTYVNPMETPPTPEVLNLVTED